jgi:hypothetical protein
MAQMLDLEVLNDALSFEFVNENIRTTPLPVCGD